MAFESWLKDTSKKAGGNKFEPISINLKLTRVETDQSIQRLPPG